MLTGATASESEVTPVAMNFADLCEGKLGLMKIENGLIKLLVPSN